MADPTKTDSAQKSRPSTSSEPAPANGQKKPGDKPKRQRKPSPFLRALRRAELLIEDLPREMAIKVAEHALFIARGLKTESGEQSDGRIPFESIANG